MNSPDRLITDHLSEDQFTELLAGETLSADVQAHLDTCEHCRVEFAQINESMKSFSDLTMDWAEHRAATLPPVRPAAANNWARPMVWASATAVAAAAIFVSAHRQSTIDTPQIAINSAPTDVAAPMSVSASQHLTREQQIAEDNQMLMTIRQELTRPRPTLSTIAGPARIRNKTSSD